MSVIIYFYASFCAVGIYQAQPEFLPLMRKIGGKKHFLPTGGDGRQHLLPSFQSIQAPNFLFIYLFIYFWLPWVFVAACELSLVAASRGYSLL